MSRSIMDMFIKLERGQTHRVGDVIINDPEENLIYAYEPLAGHPVKEEFVLRQIDMFDLLQQTKMEFVNTAKIRELSKETNDAKTLRVMIEQLCQQLDIIYK